ncbi:MAG: class II fructose-bisphosphate aldolase [Dehalococcoidia bacterium]|jgi:fructose/tagatose bisphosphate aldolase
MSIDANKIEKMLYDAVFAADAQARDKGFLEIRKLAAESGLVLASIQGLYEASGQGKYSGKTVPAMNIRGITFDTARAVFRAALKGKVGAMIFEIARSEIGYTLQRPAEYTACVLAAAMAEGYKGPVFMQGDHFQINAGKYRADAQKEAGAVKDLIREAVAAGFYNIDIDASTVVDLSKATIEEQQADNAAITADMTKFIRGIEPKGVTISIGGEIGEVGTTNSTVEDLDAFMAGYRKLIGKDVKGISKISVQTGTSHGGVVLPDGSIAKVKLDFKTLEDLSKTARKKYGMGGAVQHGASTLPDEAFHKFPEVGTVEVHLATGFQNIVFDSPHFPNSLIQKINAGLIEKYAAERKSGETDEQFLYKTRKKAFGDFKKEMWDLPDSTLAAIGAQLEERFSLLFEKLNVTDTVDLVNKYVKAK